MTYDPDKIEALIKAVDALENPKSLEIDAVIAARHALDPPKPEAPEWVWLVPHGGKAWRLGFEGEYGCVKFSRADLVIRPVKDGVGGWGCFQDSIWSGYKTKEEAEMFLPYLPKGYRIAFVRECEPE